jgi:hypothetical protein
MEQRYYMGERIENVNGKPDMHGARNIRVIDNWYWIL